jgi:hypothetical protein
LIKEKIYSKVSSKYQNQIPSLSTIQNYLKLHWSLAALKQGKLFEAVTMAFPASLSLDAWTLFKKIYHLRDPNAQQFVIQKLILIQD